MVASRNVAKVESSYPDAFPILQDWHRLIWLDDLPVPHPNPRGKPSWFQWSGVAALGFAATLDVTDIAVVGADMEGPYGGPTAGHGDRTAERWYGEWPVWEHVADFAESRGITVDRMTMDTFTAGVV